jgi:hypothetical protein
VTCAAHVSAGLLVFAYCPGPWPVRLAVAAASHIVVDAACGFHPANTWQGDTREKRVVIGVNLVGLGVAAWFAWLHPWSMVYMAAACAMDVEWLFRLEYRWSPHHWLVDWWSNRIWGYNRVRPAWLWLEVAVCLSALAVLAK